MRRVIGTGWNRERARRAREGYANGAVMKFSRSHHKGRRRRALPFFFLLLLIYRLPAVVRKRDTGAFPDTLRLSLSLMVSNHENVSPAAFGDIYI